MLIVVIRVLYEKITNNTIVNADVIFCDKCQKYYDNDKTFHPECCCKIHKVGETHCSTCHENCGKSQRHCENCHVNYENTVVPVAPIMENIVIIAMSFTRKNRPSRL